MLCLFIHLIGVWVLIRAAELPMELNKTAGESVTFPVEIPAGLHIMTVTWIVIPQRTVIAVLKSEGPAQIKASRFKERLSVIAGSYSLQINNLTQEDSGCYRAEIYTDAPKIQREFKLQVFTRMPAPDVKVHSKGKSAESSINTGGKPLGTCHIFLRIILTSIIVGIPVLCV